MKKILDEGTEAQAPKWESLQHAAEFWHVSERTLRRMIARGEIEARRIGGHLIRVNLNSAPISSKPLPQYKGATASAQKNPAAASARGAWEGLTENHLSTILPATASATGVER